SLGGSLLPDQNAVGRAGQASSGAWSCRRRPRCVARQRGTVALDSRALRPRFALGARNNCDDGELRRPIVLDVAKASTRDAWPAVATGHRSRDTGIRPPAVDIASRYSTASATQGLFTGQPPQSRPIYRKKSVRRRGWQTSQCGSGEEGSAV